LGGSWPARAVTVLLENLGGLANHAPPRGVFVLDLLGDRGRELLDERTELPEEVGPQGTACRSGRLGPDELARLVGSDLPALELLDRQHLVERAGQLSNVLQVQACDRLGDATLQLLVPLLRFPVQDRDACLVLGCRHVDDEATGEA
jgi:hypothetical protein